MTDRKIEVSNPVSDPISESVSDPVSELADTFSGEASSDLATQLTANKMHDDEYVQNYYRRHTSILKTLRDRNMSDTEILDLIEKIVFIKGLPDKKFGTMKGIYDNKHTTLEQIYTNALDVEKRFFHASLLMEFDAVTKVCGNKSDVHVVVVPPGVKAIRPCVFTDCSRLTCLTLPQTLTSIGAHAFQNCSNLTSLSLPKTLTHVGYDAFSGCSSLTSLKLPDSLTHVQSGAFQNCGNLTSVALPQTWTTVVAYAFAECKRLTALTLPVTVTRVDKLAFQDCSSLISLELPRALISVGKLAFEGCSSLTSVEFRPITSRAFITWAVGSMRNRDNWQLTTLKQSRNILRLIAELGFSKGRDVAATLDPTGDKNIFRGCTRLIRTGVHTKPQGPVSPSLDQSRDHQESMTIVS